MSVGAPWSVKGIDPKAREIAKDLARRSGMTLGQWLNAMIADQEALSDLREDVDSIKTAAKRAAQTIKDLLTLGRQGRRPKAALDLNRLVKSCLLPVAKIAGKNGQH